MFGAIDDLPDHSVSNPPEDSLVRRRRPRIPSDLSNGTETRPSNHRQTQAAAGPELAAGPLPPDLFSLSDDKDTPNPPDPNNLPAPIDQSPLAQFYRASGIPPAPPEVDRLYEATQIQRLAAKAIINPDLQAYANDNRGGLLFQMVMDGILRLPEEVCRTDFPPGLVEDNHEAEQHVHSAVKTQLKQMLPNLVNLARLVWAKLNSGTTTLTPSQIDRLFGPAARIRLAHIRLATIMNASDPQDQNISQWDQIDTTLHAHRALTGDITNHWYCLLAQLDARLFGEEPKEGKLNAAALVLPTTQAAID
ncbi:hypothetical protein PtB15_8B809 [Puccinia triticina]|nr:hypothetical protein PtB15_8B809 [Puccinia triticina]